MSDSEFSENERVSLNNVLQKYKSTKGAADKRKETSKANMAKARAAKLTALKKKKEEEANQIHIEDSSSDDSDSSDSDDSGDDGDLVIKKLKRSKGGNADSSRIARIEEALIQLAMQKGKGKKKKPAVKKKTVIQLNHPTSTHVPNPNSAALKNSIIGFSP